MFHNFRSIEEHQWSSLGTSQSTLLCIQPIWEHLGASGSISVAVQSCWVVQLWLPNRVTFCWCEQDGILLPFVHEPHRDYLLYPVDNDPRNSEANSDNGCFDQEQPPVRTRSYGSPHSDNGLARQPVSTNYFNSFDDQLDLWLLFLCKEEYWFAHWCVNRNMNTDAINERFSNPTIATVSNFTSSDTLFQRLNEMSDVMGIDSLKSAEVSDNWLADPNNLRDDDCTGCFYLNPVEWMEFLMQPPAFQEHMLYAPAMELNDGEKCINSEVKTNNWWWNKQVC